MQRGGVSLSVARGVSVWWDCRARLLGSREMDSLLVGG